MQATLWLSEEYPLSLQEQIIPIVDLMAISSSHFAKLKDFIQMQLPAGFPVKIGEIFNFIVIHSPHILISRIFTEIPLFHILNARITFGNIFAWDQQVPHVRSISESNRLTCIVEDDCFEAPNGYAKLGRCWLSVFDITLDFNHLFLLFVGAEVRSQFNMEEEDDLLQFAIQQSLLEAGSERDEVCLFFILSYNRSMFD